MRQITVGSTWKTRTGNKAIIVKIDEFNAFYPIRGFVGDKEVTWSRDGDVFDGGESEDDLMELFLEEGQGLPSLEYFRYIMGGKCE